jgi:glycosyltransferase involved in cell wall biosynthesis
MDWLGDVDVMLCPTLRTADMLTKWKHQFGFPWRVETLPWPIDVSAFRYRRRERCDRFVYVHGSGGASARRRGLASDIIRRKGLEPLLDAARELRQIPLIIYARREELERIPPNVEVRTPPKRNCDLYTDGDVCLQPSLWEGLGLPLLECQAAGMPLITTDLPPMNEHSPYAVIPATEVVAGLSPNLWIPAANICPDDIARVMRAAHGQQIPMASRQAREFVVREHNWRRVRKGLLRKIARWIHDSKSCS